MGALNTQQAAERLQREGLNHESTAVADLAKSGVFPGAQKDTYGRWLIPEDDIERFILHLKQGQRRRRKANLWKLVGGVAIPLFAAISAFLVFNSGLKDTLDLFTHYIHPLIQPSANVPITATSPSVATSITTPGTDITSLPLTEPSTTDPSLSPTMAPTTISLPAPDYAVAIKSDRFSKVILSTRLNEMRIEGVGPKSQESITSQVWLYMTNGALIEAGIFYGYLPPDGTRQIINDKEVYYINRVCKDGCVSYALFWSEHTPGAREEYFTAVASLGPNDNQNVEVMIELDRQNNTWKVRFRPEGAREYEDLSARVESGSTSQVQFGGEFIGNIPNSCADNFDMAIDLFNLRFEHTPWDDGAHFIIEDRIMNGTRYEQSPGHWFWNKPVHYNDRDNEPCP